MEEKKLCIIEIIENKKVEKLTCIRQIFIKLGNIYIEESLVTLKISAKTKIITHRTIRGQ